jgi:microcystin-dependent protein
MSSPFVGEVKMFAFNFPPRGWAFCFGQLLPISQNTALFSLLGTQYGGNGTTNFGLPDLRGRTPIHRGTLPGGSSYVQGEIIGEEVHTVTLNEMPIHGHTPNASSAAAALALPTGNTWSPTAANAFGTTAPNTTMNPASISPIGGNLPHENMPPYVVVNFCIALQGIFPSRN